MNRAAWSDVSRDMASFIDGIRDVPVTGKTDPLVLREELRSRYPLHHPQPLAEVVLDVQRLLRRHAVHVTHPRYFGLFNPSVREAGIIGDTLAALYNPQLAAWSHAPAAQELERLVLRRFAEAIDMPDATATFTTGGAEANFSAILAALAARFPETAVTGTRGLPATAIYLTAESHHSFVKIARMSGLGTAALREVATTADFAMDPRDLDRLIRHDLERGIIPLAIIGTAGTTATGALDPLPDLADRAEAYGAWFHVDAAWGAAVSLVPRLRHLLHGIERADSVTWDAHKWLSVPMGAGMFFCRRADAVRRAFAGSASYMPPGTGAAVSEPYAMTAQWSRRAIGLKVFLSLAELGTSGYAELIDHQVRMGDLLRDRLLETGWAVVNASPLPLICFTHADIRAGHLSTGDLLATLYRRGRVWISDVAPLGGEQVLRACVTSYRTAPEDLACLVAELEHARKERTRASASLP